MRSKTIAASAVGIAFVLVVAFFAYGDLERPPAQTPGGLSLGDLLAMAGNGFSSGQVPLGDGKFTVGVVEKGYVDYCSAPRSGGGAEGSAPWIRNGNWTPSEKPSVTGAVGWSNAEFSDTISGGTRVLSGNGLPVNLTTGVFPISKSDPAHRYDANPNSIEPHNVTLAVPLDPAQSAAPHCMTPGMVGLMLDGVPLFDGMDAQQRDAVAHEVQDSCDGHPQELGVYHYHGLSSCFQDINETHVLGYALDGFPITGPEVAPGKYLSTSNLDACHGITSQVTDENGRTYVTYHYVLTFDFPYSISCYRGVPATNGKV